MDRRLAVLIVHGVGAQTKGFSLPMEKNLKKHFIKALEHMKVPDPPKPKEALIFKEGLWADITQIGQDKLKELLFDDKNTKMDWLKVRKFFINNLGDAIAYFKGADDDSYSQYPKIQKRIHSHIQALSSETDPDQNTLLTVVSHSLGTVILSDYFYDKRKILKPENKLIFSNFFTMGSPIALYANRFYNHRNPSQPFIRFKPQKLADSLGVWVNMFDRDDIVGHPIRPLNKHCKKVVTADLNISVGSVWSGWTPLSHLAYWKDKDIGKIIAEKLAIDWLRVNKRDTSATTKKRIRNYKKRYRMP